MWKIIRITLAVLLFVLAAVLMILALISEKTMIGYDMVNSGFDFGLFCTQLTTFIVVIAYILNFKSKPFLILFIIFIMINGFIVFKMYCNISWLLSEHNLYRT